MGQVEGQLIGIHVIVPKASSFQNMPVGYIPVGRPSYFAKKRDEQMATSRRALSLPPYTGESSTAYLPAPQGSEQEPDSSLPTLPWGCLLTS